MKNTYFSALLPELATRAAYATVSRLGFSNTPLRHHLTQLFSNAIGEPGCFLGQPVFEATFGWQAADTTLARLSGNLLSKALVDALDAPSVSNDYKPEVGKGKPYRFPKNSSLSTSTRGLAKTIASTTTISGCHQWYWLRQNRMFYGADIG